MTDALAQDPFSDWPGRTPVYDNDGQLILVVSLTEATRSGRPWADGAWRPESSPVEVAHETVLNAFSGFAFSTSDPPLVEALLTSGSQRLRHAHSMSHPLTDVPDQPVNPAVSVQPLPADDLLANADRLGEINFRAYPPGHPDHERADVAQAVREVTGIGLGEILGPYLDVSQVALVDDNLVGACLVVDRDGTPPEGGPWIVDVFRDPDVAVPGVGKALLIGAIAASRLAHLPGLSLAVSHENANAFGLYGSLGFVDASQSWTLAIP